MKEKDEIFSKLDQTGKIFDKVINEDITLDFSLINYTFKNQEGFLFKKVTFMGDFTFCNFNSKEISSIEFEECSFLGYVEFIDISAQLELLSIRNCFFNHDFDHVFSAIEVDVFVFNENKIHECIMYSILTDNLIIENCIIIKELALYEIEGEYAEINNDEDNICHKLTIRSPKIKQVVIKSKNGIKSLNLSELDTGYINGSFDLIEINSTDFTKIEITNILEIEDSKKYYKIREIKYQDTNFQGLLTLEDLEIENLIFDGLNLSNGSVRLNEITIKDTIIYDCSISNFYWNQVKFINPPDISRSYLSELKMANVSWQNKRLKNSFLDDKIPLLYGLRKKWLKKYKTDFDTFEISDLKYQIETYRQLKAASISNHNPIEGLTFYRNEMKLYWKLIRIEGGIPWYDRILIFINRWSSDFGQNWFLPLLWITITTSTFYFTITQPTLSYKPLDILNGILEVLYYINPVRKIDENLPETVQGLDVLLRAINAYFIYHFIKASRKFGKV